MNFLFKQLFFTLLSDINGYVRFVVVSVGL